MGLIDNASTSARRQVGRYVLYGEISRGGMATVHFGRFAGEGGFSRTVAIKCLHAQFASDPEFRAMLLDEARLAARVRHPNVVPILDVVATDGELFMVMEYVQGEPLSRLLRKVRLEGRLVPPSFVAAIMTDVLEGLHAAHEAKSERGEALEIVHRDVSPQNVMIGVDGVARVLDFGIAKAAGRAQTTHEGRVKGKLPYMSPEQLRGTKVDRRTDVYASAVVMWEALVGRRLFEADDEAGVYAKVLEAEVEMPGKLVSGIPKAIDEVMRVALQRDPAKRYQTARQMAIAIEKAIELAAPRQVEQWLVSAAGETLRERADLLAEIESASSPGLAEVFRSAVAVNPPAEGSSALRLLVDLQSKTSPGIEAPSPSGSKPPTGSTQSGPDTSPTQITATTTSRLSRSSLQRQTRVAALVGVGAGLLVGGGILLAVLAQRPEQGRGEGSPARAPSAVLPQASQAVSAVASVSSAEASASAVASAKPPASGGARSSGTEKRTVKGATSANPPASDTSTVPARPPNDCTPPYTVDDRGVRVPKPQCL